MRLTTKGRYAVTAMLDLALNAGQAPVRLAEISRRQEISLSYLEQLFSRLRQSGLVSSVRGPGGGYRLSGTAEDIDVAAIIDAVNESVDATSCGGNSDCAAGEQCLTHYLWSDLSAQIHNFLGGISLADLARRTEVQQVARRQNLQQAPAEEPVAILGNLQ